MIPGTERHASGAAQSVQDGALALRDLGDHRVAVLSAALLQAVMNTYREDQNRFARRAGVAATVVAEAVGGKRPAWELPYDQFMALADAVAAVWPCAAFETAAACDLLLSCVLNGDQFMATDVLTDPCSQDLAQALLRLAVTTEPDNGIRRRQDALLPEDLLALLSERAAALAGSGSPDAWVGAEILAGCSGRQS